LEADPGSRLRLLCDNLAMRALGVWLFVAGCTTPARALVGAIAPRLPDAEFSDSGVIRAAFYLAISAR
jgi:hypothetical protein